jgi:hypothetical protein
MKIHARFVAYLSFILLSFSNSTFACPVSQTAIVWLPEAEICVGFFSDSSEAEALIAFQLPQSAYVNLKVYDPAGMEVATLIDGWNRAGWHLVNFDCSSLIPGIYRYTLSAGELSAKGQMALVK